MTKILIVDDVKGWRDFNSNIANLLFGEDIVLDTAESAQQGYEKILENNNEPYDIVITDMQMEDDFAPKHAGEWLVEQIKMLSKYYKTKIVIVSASSNIRQVAESLGIDCIPKSTAINCISAYEEILLH